jgi:hypothetical protein
VGDIGPGRGSQSRAQVSTRATGNVVSTPSSGVDGASVDSPTVMPALSPSKAMRPGSCWRSPLASSMAPYGAAIPANEESYRPGAMPFSEGGTA